MLNATGITSAKCPATGTAEQQKKPLQVTPLEVTVQGKLQNF